MSPITILVAACACQFFFGSTLEIKGRNTLVVAELEDQCSECEKDEAVSWDVKCTYENSCGLCPACSSGKPETPAFDMYHTGHEWDCASRCHIEPRCAWSEWDADTLICAFFEQTNTIAHALAPAPDASSHSATLAKHFVEESPMQQKDLGWGIAEGCPRGHDCGYEGGVSKEAVKISCEDGERWMAPNAIVIRGRKGTSAIYCSVPKVGTSYTLGVMEDLGLPVKDGNRNAGYENVGDIAHRNDTHEIKELCEAYSFIVIRNPWERIASAYVDKVLTREVFKEPPSFYHFIQSLAQLEHPEHINQHFRPASELCHTTKALYDEKIKIEGSREDSLPSRLRSIFITKLKLEPQFVHKVFADAASKQHPTSIGSRWREIDPSIESGMSRVDYYFRQSDPQLAAKLYKNDIEYGGYWQQQRGVQRKQYFPAAQ